MILAIGPWQLILIFLVFLPTVLLPIIALIGIVKNDFPGSNDKLIWILITLLLPFFGPLLYFVFGRPKRLKH